ncbi:MAG: hypothetical protein ACYTF1_01270 [Planctomycetota bacterium]
MTKVGRARPASRLIKRRWDVYYVVTFEIMQFAAGYGVEDESTKDCQPW